ncbi:hypothetical protein WDZ92_53275 [Nostoc sp. NIES-2111]
MTDHLLFRAGLTVPQMISFIEKCPEGFTPVVWQAADKVVAYFVAEHAMGPETLSKVTVVERGLLDELHRMAEVAA